MTTSDPTVEAVSASHLLALPNSHRTASRLRDASVLLVGIFVGAAFSWAFVRSEGIYPRAVDRVAHEVRLEVEKNHPELLKDVTPFIDCAVVRQKTNGRLFAYLVDRSLLMPSFRSNVALCAKAADDLLEKAAKTSNANAQATDLALPTTVAGPAVLLPEFHKNQAGALSSMPELSQSFQPSQQLPAVAFGAIVPGEKEATAATANGFPQVFTSESIGALVPVVPPLGNLGGLISPVPAQSPLQVVKPPEK